MPDETTNPNPIIRRIPRPGEVARPTVVLPLAGDKKAKLKVGETKAPKIEVDRKAFAKMVKSLTHGYTHFYTGLAGVRIFAQMAGVTSGNYDDEKAFHAKMLEEASE